MTTPALTPIPCSSCGHPDDWRQAVRLLADYPLLVQEDGTYAFGAIDPDVENEEVIAYRCNWCHADADLETIDAIAGRIR